MSMAAGGGWRLDKLGGSKIFGDEGLVAACPRIADARRVVRCVNAHDDLVAALVSALRVIEIAVRNAAPQFDPAEHVVIKQIDAALTKARGEG